MVSILNCFWRAFLLFFDARSSRNHSIVALFGVRKVNAEALLCDVAPPPATTLIGVFGDAIENMKSLSCKCVRYSCGSDDELQKSDCTFERLIVQAPLHNRVRWTLSRLDLASTDKTDIIMSAFMRFTSFGSVTLLHVNHHKY